MALIISTWHWGTKYSPEYVAKLRAGITRHLRQEHRFVVFAPAAEDKYLTEIQGCYCRLHMFDPAWQEANGIHPGDRLVCIDLDTVVSGPLDALFDRPEPFCILHGGNFGNPCPFGGALQMLRAGAHPEVWDTFSVEAAAKVPFYLFPDDQGWLWHKLPNAAGWKCGAESGVYVFRKPGWPKIGDRLPPGARIVTFNGWRSPETFKQLDWVKQHWTV